MFGRKKWVGGGYSVSGTAQNVSDAIKEQELTNREGIQADKEVKQAEWQINLENAKAEREGRLAQKKHDLDVKLAAIKAKSNVDMKQTTAGLTSDQNYNIQSEGLQNARLENQNETDVRQQKSQEDHAFRMERLKCQMKAVEMGYSERSEQLASRHNMTMGAMGNDHEQTRLAIEQKGKIVMTALKKGGKSFRLNANALNFGDTRSMTKKIGSLTQGIQQNQSRFEAIKMNDPSRNQAIALPGPGGAFVDSDGEDEDDSSLFDMDVNMEMEEMKFEGELKREEMKLAQMKLDKGLEMEKLKLDQQKNEIELANLALLAKQL